jgi:hypothetical protein
MVAPIVIAGLGVILSGIATAVLGKKNPSFAVVRIGRRGVIGKTFDDVAAAEAYQEQLSTHGYGSIIVQRIDATDGHGRSYVSLHPVQGMAPAKKMGGLGAAFAIAPPGYWLVKWRAPGSTAEHLEVFQWEREAKERERDLDQQAVMVSTSMIPRTKRTVHAPKPAPKKMGSFKSPYDTHEQSQNQMYMTTRFPSPERFEKAITGPYPETAIYNQDYLPESPLFDDTTSSHMWRSDVIPKKVPTSGDSAVDVGYKQPDVLVVDQALQDPEPVIHHGKMKSNDHASNDREAMVTHGPRSSHVDHKITKQPDLLSDQD